MLYKLSPHAALAVIFAFLTTGCPNVEPVTEMPGTPDAREMRSELTFRVVASGSHAPVAPGEYVYRDAEEWRAVAQGIRDPAYEPSLSLEGVLLASVHANTGGYNVRFDSLYIEGGADVVAIYAVEEPGPDCMVTQALTQPFQAIAVPDLPPGPVRFVQRRRTYAC